MSAWVTSKAHIDAMVTKAIAQGGDHSDPYGYIYMPKADGEGYDKIDLSPANADRVGELLRDTIVTGVHHRYPGDDVSKGELPGPSGGEAVWYLKPYKWEKTRELADGETVSLIHCYEYQASEHNDWTNTFGWKFCEHVKYKLLQRVQMAWEAEHGSKAEWGYEDEHVYGGFAKWAVVMRAIEFRPNCGGPLVLVPARNAEEAMAKANAWYDGEAISAAVHPAELAPEEIEAEAKRNAEWAAEQQAEQAPETRRVKALDPEVDKLLEELAALGEPGETPTIRNNRTK